MRIFEVDLKQYPLTDISYMDVYSTLIIICTLVIFSYLFDLLAKRTKIPSVLLLLFTGIILHFVVDYFGFKTYNFFTVLPTLGTVGLILIVLEGSLELKYEPSKTKLIRNAFFTAFFLLISTAACITLLFHFFTHQPLRMCLLNAIPFSIISSAIAIPSVSNILSHKKEFIIYESSFSDILGIMLFNFALTNDTYTPGSFLDLGVELLVLAVSSVALCLLLLYMLGRITHHIKFFLLIAILILVYALGKHFHLSSLVIILAFGLFLNNAEKIRIPLFRKIFDYTTRADDLQRLFQLTAESAFIVRTFFFLIFGFTMNVMNLISLNVLLYGMGVLIVIYGLRYVYLKYIARTELTPELFITPRGLISILIYYSIPDMYKIPGIESGLLFLVILCTSIFMTVGLLRMKKTEGASPIAESAPNTIIDSD